MTQAGKATPTQTSNAIDAGETNSPAKCLRVVVGVQGEGLNGIDTYAEQVAAVGSAQGHQVTLIVTSADVAALVAKRLPSEVRVVHLGLAAPTKFEKIAGRLWHSIAMRRLRPALRRLLAAGDLGAFDIAHLNHPALAVEVHNVPNAARRIAVGAWFYPHAMLSRVAHTWDHNRGPVARRTVLAAKSVGYFLGDRAGYAVADMIFTPTKMLAEQLEAQGLPTGHCPPPVQVAAGSRPNSDAGSPIRLLAVSGDLSHPRKNLQHVLVAAGHLAKLNPQRTIVCEMIGRNADALRVDATTLPSNVTVEFPGALERTIVHQRMLNADALVFPSLYEEWGYVAVESLLMGTPVVTYPVYPFADMLAGIGGIAEGSEPEQLARAIDRAVSSTNRAELAAAAAARYGTPAIGRRLTELWLTADRAV